MQKKTMGSFMAALRKANGLTQQQVADKLNVSNKTVSKWECDEGCPEISMLPMIAEFYSVSVDELLRGERITNTRNKEASETKNEERIKYLFKKSKTKFTNSSIISIVLGAIALVLSYTICDIISSLNMLWFGCVIILILCGSSIALSLISLNDFISNLYNGDIVKNDSIETNMSNCIKYLSIIIYLAITTLQGLLLNVFLEVRYNLIFWCPIIMIISCVITYFIRLGLYKKFNIVNKELSTEQIKYRKKHIIITAAVLLTVAIISIIIPVIIVLIENNQRLYYTFPDGVGYQYETNQEAKREYYKLKNHITGKKPLYEISTEYYSEENDEFILYVIPMQDKFEYSKKGYNIVKTENPTNREEFHFKTNIEMEKFISANVCDEFNAGNMEQKNIIFDDKTFSISYKANQTPLNGLNDIMPMFIVFGCYGNIIVFIYSCLKYYKKNKA